MTTDSPGCARVREGKGFMHYGDCDIYQGRDGSRGACNCDAAADLEWFLAEFDSLEAKLAWHETEMSKIPDEAWNLHGSSDPDA
jgi:hypothetical protein